MSRGVRLKFLGQTFEAAICARVSCRTPDFDGMDALLSTLVLIDID